MYTYDVVSESVRNPHQLAEELTKRSANGWEVVQITFDGAAWFHAFIRHAGSVPVGPHAKAEELQPAVPASTPATPVATASSPSSAATGATPNVPADWHKDPSGRFELRYWNGTAWTEHVATGGKQSIDPIR
jgi:hypothetical protein